MPSKICKWCGKYFDNVGAHRRFCKEKPDEKVKKEPEIEEQEQQQQPMEQFERIDTEPPENEQERQLTDVMFTIDHRYLDAFGDPVQLATKARLGKNMDEAKRLARIDTNIKATEMKRNKFGVHSLLVRVEDIQNGIRSLNGFIGNRIRTVDIQGVKYYKINITLEQIYKAKFLMHTIPLGGMARQEDIWRNTVTPENPMGVEIAPPPRIYPKSDPGIKPSSLTDE